MKKVLLSAGVAVAITAAAPAHADVAGKDQAFLNSLTQAGLVYMNPDRAIAAGKSVCQLAGAGMEGTEIVKNLQDKNPGFQGDGAAKFTALAAQAYCPEELTPAGTAPASANGGR